MMHRYGALDVEDASPVRVQLQTKRPFTLSVVDNGIGVCASKEIWNYGYTTNASTHEAEWR